MSSYPMVEQVDLLVGNLLAGDSEVFLPGVGSLYIERRCARRLSKRSVEPPCRVVSFASQQRGAALAEHIARAAACDEAAAQDIYNRWLSCVRTDEALVIEGVGTLRLKHFTPDEAFDKRLNPQGHAPMRIRSGGRFDWALWCGIAAILIALVVGGSQFLMLYPGSAEDQEVVAEKTTAPAAPAMPADTLVDTLAAAQTVDRQTAAAETAAQTAASQAPAAKPAVSAGTPSAPASFAPGRKYVVLGVFSTQENAARAIRGAVAEEPSLRCEIFRFGDKFLVSPFVSDDAAACAQFIRSQADRFPDMWTYTAR